MFDKVLIANRGEVAVRVLRACREEGLRTVAVYSEPDRTAPHVLLANESVRVGEAPAADSYLNVDRLLEAASLTAAGAIHPGYGFLAENADFARRVEAAGLAFIGPPAEAIEEMGDKTRARARMVAAGVPVVPGSDTVADVDQALEEAARIGYPVMLKATAGGGGKGMRTVADPEQLGGVYEGAVREAKRAFGDGRVYLERFLDRPRHIEIQILADDERVVPLGERECSIQRRHQKLIEESPSMALDDATRKEMAAVAVRAAKAVGYRGAGTVEFLYQGGEFFFLEMNTRLQVEHPVTEFVTGVDLVREQLRIVRGGLALGGSKRPRPHGHAIECRISAEDPDRGFLPSTGTIAVLEIPAGPGVRWDGGVRVGSRSGLEYDPLLGKLIAHAEDRPSAIDRMRTALADLRIEGVATTTPFHLAVMHEADFGSGEVSVRYVEQHPGLMDEDESTAPEVALAAALYFEERHGPHRDGTLTTPLDRHGRPGVSGREVSAWVRAIRDR